MTPAVWLEMPPPGVSHLIEADAIDPADVIFQVIQRQAIEGDAPQSIGQLAVAGDVQGEAAGNVFPGFFQH